jgi:hypothetical protein
MAEPSLESAAGETTSLRRLSKRTIHPDMRRDRPRIELLIVLAVAACAGAPRPGAAPAPVPAPAAPVETPRVVLPDVPATGEGTDLVAAFREAEKRPERDARWRELRRIATELRKLADPRAADALAAYLATAPSWEGSGEKLHFQSELAFALAELGDLRALSTLARRLRVDPLEAYGDGPFEQELRRSDDERVVAARSIADLATLHPRALATVRSRTEDSLLAWVDSRPAPHANGLRALATMQSTKQRFPERLLAWADPAVALPAEGEPPPFRLEFEIAQSALRYLGRTRHPAAFATLKKQLARREPHLDVTLDALQSGENVLLGMTLASLAGGASDGFSELGDSHAFPLLLAHVDNDKENERSRQRACEAAAWLAGDVGAKQLVTRLARWSQESTPSAAFRRGCLWSALAVRPVRGLHARTLLDFWKSEPTIENRLAAARAVALAGIDAVAEQRLTKWLSDRSLGVPAALALLLGGTADAARRAIESLSDDELTALSGSYLPESSFVSEGDIEAGRLERWVENAALVATLERGGKAQTWARARLEQVLGAVQYDQGPHSLTRTVMRQRLLEAAYRGSLDSRKRVVAVLELMRERGVLLRIAAEGDELAPFAAEAEKRAAAR